MRALRAGGVKRDVANFACSKRPSVFASAMSDGEAGGSLDAKVYAKAIVANRAAAEARNFSGLIQIVTPWNMRSPSIQASTTGTIKALVMMVSQTNTSLVMARLWPAPLAC